MPLEETLEEIKKYISFKKDTFVGDILLVGMPAGVSYAIVQNKLAMMAFSFQVLHRNRCI